MTAVLHSQSSVSGLSLSQLTGNRRQNSLKESKSSLNSDMSAPDLGNDEDATITINKNIGVDSRKSLDDLQFLAISAQITEIGYGISDVQTRIFEIQELRHKAEAQAPAASGTAATTSVDGHTVSTEPSTTNIDQALINLDEKLESITASISAIDVALEPIIKASKTPTSSVPLSAKTPTQANTFPSDDNAATLLRKHSALLQDWEAVQEEAETLKGELREDKWLAVFRTVGEQAEAMMVSLEKAVAHCQEFIWQVHKKAATEDSHSQVSSGSNWGTDRPVNYEVFQSLLSSYEAKKRYYIPATTKVLSILDRSVRDRVTKNGECLRRHAEARARWKNLRERIGRIDSDMENVRLYFVNKEREHNEPEPSDAGSTLSRQTSRSNVTNKSNYLSTPSMFSRKSTSDTSGTRSRADSGTNSAVSRTMSPLRRFASKVTASMRSSSSVSDGRSPIPSRTTSSVSISAPKQLKSSPSGNSTNNASSTSGVATKAGPPKPPPRSPFRPSGNRMAVSSPEPPEAIEVDNDSKKKRESLFPFLSKPPPPSALGRSTSRAPSRSSMSGGDTSSSSTKPRWSSNTKIEYAPPPSSQNNTIRATPSRPSIVNHAFRPITPSEGGRSVSRNDNRNGPSRPGSSMKGHTSWNSLSALDASNPPPPLPPRAQSRTGARTPSSGFYSTSPRARPETPSGIPVPLPDHKRSPSRAASEADYFGRSEDDGIPTTLMQRAFTPGPSPGPRATTPGGTLARSRRPSNSLIPVPKLNITSGSRPGTAMSMSPGGSRATSPSLSADGHGRKSPGVVKESPSAWKGVGADSPSNGLRAGARSQTPESMLRARAMQTPVFLDNEADSYKATYGHNASSNGAAKSPNGAAVTPARSRQSVGAPSSFKGEKGDSKTLTYGPGGDGPDVKSPSRPGSRFGRSMTPMDGPLQPYVPVKTDELDVEVANILNGMAHGFLIERIDPPRKTPAKAGEEIRAQYAVSNALGRKVITCRLVTVTRGGAQSKKVMCRVGGGWLELQMYILNRQAGLS